MAWFQVNFFSTSLKRQVALNVLIPADADIGTPPSGDKQFKTLYLLHGFAGNNSHWLLSTRIAELSRQLDLAIVMPSGENAFYVDIEHSGRMYSEFISRELVDFTRSVFPLSRKTKDTIIGGLSMGGYGALYNGLRHTDVFGHVIALSSALVVEDAVKSTDVPNPLGTSRGYFEEVFGDLDKVMESERNLEVLANNALDRGEITDLYIACGYNDVLVHPNRKLSAYLTEIGYRHVYEEGAGSHDWAFWEEFLKRGLDRLELVPKREPRKPPFWVDERDTSPNPVT